MAESRRSGKLAVILHADVAGSTLLVQQDEHLAHERIQDTFRRFGNTISKYHGQVRELRGDALLAEFERASDAVTAALAFQADQADYAAQLDDDIRPTVRVGIALGEVVIADSTVTGAGVVLAQRLEQLAEPGRVCITGAIHEALPQRMPFDQENLGDRQVKGFDEPVRVYRVDLNPGESIPLPQEIGQGEASSKMRRPILAVAVIALVIVGGSAYWFIPWTPQEEPASVKNMAFPLPDKPSIAVLPFENYSDDPKMEFFASGLAQDLTSAFSRSPWLFVIARNSAATYMGQPVNIKKVAEDLGVQYVLEGSVQKAGDELRITAQLIDALTGKHLWAGRFDQPASDIFAVQDEITKRVLTELQVKLTMGDSARVRSHGTRNLEAWLLQLEGYSEMQKWTKEHLIRARELYAAANEADPNWAWPLAGTALTHWFDAKQGWNESRDESIRLGFEFAERATEVDPNGPLGHYALGNMYFLTNQPERGAELQRKAIELAPNDFNMVAGMAMRIKDFGQEREAIELFEHAMRLSPKHPWWVPFGYGLALHLVGRKEDAVQTYKKAIDLGAKNARTYARLAAVYVDMRRMDDANAAIEEALRLEPNFTVSNYEKAYPLHDPKRGAWYKDLLLKSGLPEHPPLPLTDKPSIAVLPFTNMSDDPKQEYFVDGMSEDLITDLSKISGLFVIASNSSFTYKGKAVDVKQVGRELGVKYILEGSVRRAGDQVRINAQLIDATTGGHLWAERYDGGMKNVFSLQDEITSKIVTALAVQLTANEETKQNERQTDSPQAYEAFLKGWEHYRRDTTDHYAKAMKYFQKAVNLDPEYSRAYAAMASIYWKSYLDEFYQVFSIGRTDARERGQQLLKLALRSPSSLAYQAASEISLWRRNFDEAISNGEKAIVLEPNSAGGRVVLAKALIFSGRPKEALDLIDRAEQLDPLAQARYGFVRGLALFGMEQYAQAAESLERARELNPEDWADKEPGKTWCYPCVMLAATYGHLGSTENAKSMIAYLKAFGYHRNRIADIAANWPYKEVADAKRFSEGLRKAEMPE